MLRHMLQLASNLTHSYIHISHSLWCYMNRVRPWTPCQGTERPNRPYLPSPASLGASTYTPTASSSKSSVSAQAEFPRHCLRSPLGTARALLLCPNDFMVIHKGGQARAKGDPSTGRAAPSPTGHSPTAPKQVQAGDEGYQPSDRVKSYI